MEKSQHWKTRQSYPPPRHMDIYPAIGWRSFICLSVIRFFLFLRIFFLLLACLLPLWLLFFSPLSANSFSYSLVDIFTTPISVCVKKSIESNGLSYGDRLVFNRNRPIRPTANTDDGYFISNKNKKDGILFSLSFHQVMDRTIRRRRSPSWQKRPVRRPMAANTFANQVSNHSNQ